MKFNQWLEARYVNWMAEDGKYKTQSEFAKWLGIHRSQLNMYLNGSRTPTGENVDKLAKRLGPEIYDILGLARPDEDLQYIASQWHIIPNWLKKRIVRDIEETRADNLNDNDEQPAHT